MLIENYDESMKFIKALNDPYKDKLLDSEIETHETITTLRNLRDLCDDEAAYYHWNNMSDKEQIKFLVDFVSNHYFYLFNRSDESFNIHRIDTIKSKVANFETKKIIQLLYKYNQIEDKKIEKINLKNFVFDLLDIINDRFLFEDEVFEKMSDMLAGTELLYYDMPRNKFENLKKSNLQSKEKIISKSTDVNEIIEELQYYIYCTYYHFIKKVIFEQLVENLPKKLKIYSRKGYGEINKQLNPFWKMINEDNL